MAFAFIGHANAGQEIVSDGVAKAEIVVAAERPRMVTLAALELQYYLKKISGAELPIVTEPTAGVETKIYVGRSAGTDKLGISTEGLKYGAYRIVSDGNFLALLGNDSDFSPPEPWGRKPADIPRAQQEWDAIVAKTNDVSWGQPFRSMYKNEFGGKSTEEPMLMRYGAANEKLWPDGDYASGFWAQDEGGTFHAVFGYLNTLGARFYMPGELGEILPEQKTISLSAIDETVKPAYALRAWNWYNQSAADFENVLWYRQIGNNAGQEVLGSNLTYAHGLVQVHQREDFKAKYPKAFALVGKNRDTEHRGYGTACFSSPELVDQTVKYARFMFDTYNQPHVSVWPTDGIKICQCELCQGKDPSELVWTFVDKVGRELYKTHPDRMVTCGGYTSYRLAPSSIEKFSPNVGVFTSNWSRPMFVDPETWNEYWKMTQDWEKRLAPGRLLRVENNRYSISEGEDNDWKNSFPVPQARAIAKELKALKGISVGEISEQSQKAGTMINPALNAFPLYVMARYFWNPDVDFEQTLDEFLSSFYGPASEEMKKAYLFSESAYLKSSLAAGGKTARLPQNVPIEDRITLVEMLQDARAKAGDTVYGKRIELFLSELQSLDELKVALENRNKAGNVRDDALVVELPPQGESAPLAFKENSKQRDPEVGTTVQVSQEKDALIFTIRCEEPDMANLLSTPDIYGGDSVVILLEPPGHSYYHLEINPDGKLFDKDHGNPVGERWESQASVKAERGENFWQVRVKVPVVDPGSGEGDPNHNVVGAMPTKASPWFFNVGRSRVRGQTAEVSMLSPTGKKGYHNPGKFAKLAPGKATAAE